MSHISVSSLEPLPDLLICPHDVSFLKISVVIQRPILTKLNSSLFPKTCSSHILSKCHLLHCLTLMSGRSAKYIQNLTISSHLHSCHPGLVRSYGLPTPSRSLLSGLCAPHSLFLIRSEGDTEYLYQVIFLSCPVPSFGSVSHSNRQCSFRGLCKAHEPCKAVHDPSLLTSLPAPFTLLTLLQPHSPQGLCT